jgi:hypothetical protein
MTDETVITPAEEPRCNVSHLLSKIASGKTSLKQLRDVVPIEEWIHSPYYSGYDARHLYPYWRTEIINFINSGLAEWILTGSIGAGKTTAASYALIYKLYVLSCFSPIPALFNLFTSTEIFFIYFSVNMKQADRTGYGKLRSIVDSIEYFHENFRRNTRVTSSLQFKNVNVIYGSGTDHQIGLDLFGVFLDEGDFYAVKGSGGNEFSKARDLYTSTFNRRKARFSLGGIDQGISLLVSSASFNSCFVEQRIVEAKKSKSAYISVAVGYKVIVPRKYSKEWFPVFPGSKDVPTTVIKNRHDIFDILRHQEMPIPEEDFVMPYVDVLRKYIRILGLEKVPIDFIEAFEQDINKASRDVLGVAANAISGFLTAEAIIDTVRYYVPNLFSRSVVTLSTKSDTRLEDFFNDSPVFSRSTPRWIHIDQSVSSDRTGIACTLVAGSGLNANEFLTCTEWMVAISPPIEGQIPVIRCAEFVIHLRSLGYNIVKVTMDTYQSTASLQYFESEGIPTAILSVDRDDVAYVTLRKQVLQGVHISCENRIFIDEVSKLDWDRERRKIDHPDHGSKDIADAVAASTHCAVLEFPYHSVQVVMSDVKDEDDLYDDFMYPHGRYHEFKKVVQLLQQEYPE